MQKQQERMIDGLNIQVSQLPAMRSLRLFHRLGKSIGPAIAKATDAFEQEKEGLKVSEMGQAIESLFATLSEQDLEILTKELLSTALADGAPILPQLDVLLQGKLLTLFKILAFAIEVNYSDFFGAARGLAQSGSLASKVSALTPQNA